MPPSLRLYSARSTPNALRYCAGVPCSLTVRVSASTLLTDSPFASAKLLTASIDDGAAARSPAFAAWNGFGSTFWVGLSSTEISIGSAGLLPRTFWHP